MGAEISDAALAASHFWCEPSMKKLGKIDHPNIKYTVGKMYRGNKSIITAEEFKASLKILNAYRRYKERCRQLVINKY